MLILRPCRLSDLPEVERVARASAVGITTLPPDRERLYDKLRDAVHALASEVDFAGDEQYFFVLEDTAAGQIVGTSGIVAAAGLRSRFYSYRNEILVHASPELGVHNKIHTLHLCHDLTGYTLLSSFYIDPAHEAGPAPQLLSRARLLFIAEHPHRFADRIAAESPGVCDAEGRSPFWDAVGRRFFNRDYSTIEQLAGGRSKSFIAELMPQYPLYVPLLPADARLAIGQLHPVGELPFSILLDEGFDADTYVDIFDAGPTVEARVATLRSVTGSRRVRACSGGAATATRPWLVANTETEGFRATVADLPEPQDGHMALPDTLMAALEVAAGDDLRICPLD